MRSKFYKSWKFVLFLSVVALYILFFSVLYRQEVKTFVDGWSRELLIAEIQDLQTSDLMNIKNSYAVPIPEENLFLSIWYAHESIHFSVISETGKILSTQRLEFAVPGSIRLEALRDEDNIYLYNLHNKILYQYQFNWRTSQSMGEMTIAEDINALTALEDTVIYGGEGGLFLYRKGMKTTPLIHESSILGVEATYDHQEKQYHMAFVEVQEGLRFLKYGTYDGAFQSQPLSTLPNQPTLTISQLDLIKHADNVHVILSTSNMKSNNAPIINYYSFDHKNPEQAEVFPIKIDSYAPNPMIIGVDKLHLHFIASEDIKKGRNTKVTNLVLYTMEKDRIISKHLLTNTEDTSLYPQYFKLNKNKYMQWTHLSGKSKSLYLASDHPEVVQATSKLKGDEWAKLLADTLIGLIPIGFLALIPLMNIFLPVCLLLFLISVLKLTWMENNANRVLPMAIGLHILLKIYYTVKNIINNEMLGDSMPWFLQSPMIIFLFILFTTLVALYCAYDRQKKKNGHFFMTYTFFAVIDTLLYSLLFLPYFYTDLILSYFTRL